MNNCKEILDFSGKWFCCELLEGHNCEHRVTGSCDGIPYTLEWDSSETQPSIETLEQPSPLRIVPSTATGNAGD